MNRSAIGFLVPALALSASAQTLASLPAPRAIAVIEVPRVLPGPLSGLGLPLIPVSLPGPAIPVLTPHPALLASVVPLPAIRMDVDKEMHPAIRPLLPLHRRLAKESDQREETTSKPERSPALDELFDGVPAVRPGRSVGLPERELEKDLGL